MVSKMAFSRRMYHKTNRNKTILETDTHSSNVYSYEWRRKIHFLKCNKKQQIITRVGKFIHKTLKDRSEHIIITMLCMSHMQCHKVYWVFIRFLMGMHAYSYDINAHTSIILPSKFMPLRFSVPLFSLLYSVLYFNCCKDIYAYVYM